MMTNSVLTIMSSPLPRKKNFSRNHRTKNSEEQNSEQPQLIGEQRRDNAIFKVYLKRIRQKSTSISGSSSTLSTLVDNTNDQNETTGGIHNNEHGTLLYSTIKICQLKAGTLSKIVEHLTNDDGELDITHMNILFSTYRTFTNTQILVETLITQYRNILPASLDMTEDIRQKTLKSLRKAITFLLNEYKEDFNDSPCYTTLNYLIKNLPDRDVRKQGQVLLEKLKNDEENIQLQNENRSSEKNDLFNETGFVYLTPWNIFDISSKTIAEQLTIVDADLFKRVLPYESLTMSAGGSSRRTSGNNNSNRILSTIDKTIEYFNAVVARVIATILKEQEEQIRANVIEKWIRVAQECRNLKNFSSLTAILNGLLSGCIHRLKRAWGFVTEESWSIFEELRNVFGNCGDRKQARTILDKQLDEVRLVIPECSEGTAKSPVLSTSHNESLAKKVLQKVIREQQKLTMIGTVPYLGLYLSDLTYIDSAYPNTIMIENDDKSTLKLINFEKHRKEYEVLAQIKLFQSAANFYTTFHPLPRFKAWFDNVRTYNDTESWDLSYQIESKETTDNSHSQEQSVSSHSSYTPKPFTRRVPSEASLESLVMFPHNQHGHTRSLRSSPSSTSLDKISTISSSSPQIRNLGRQKIRKEINSQSNHIRSSSSSSFLLSSNGSASQGYISATDSSNIYTERNTSNNDEDETIIAKVQFVGKDDLLYKKVRIKNNERTKTVLKTILDKFGLDPSNSDRYCIEQLLPNRKIVIPDQSNVFYALVRSSNNEQIDLIVREKTRQEYEQKPVSLLGDLGHNRTPSGLSISSAHSR